MTEIISIPKIPIELFRDEVEENRNSDTDKDSYLNFLLQKEGWSLFACKMQHVDIQSC